MRRFFCLQTAKNASYNLYVLRVGCICCSCVCRRKSHKTSRSGLRKQAARPTGEWCGRGVSKKSVRAQNTGGEDRRKRKVFPKKFMLHRHILFVNCIRFAVSICIFESRFIFSVALICSIRVKVQRCFLSSYSLRTLYG